MLLFIYFHIKRLNLNFEKKVTVMKNRMHNKLRPRAAKRRSSFVYMIAWTETCMSLLELDIILSTTDISLNCFSWDSHHASVSVMEPGVQARFPWKPTTLTVVLALPLMLRSEVRLTWWHKTKHILNIFFDH